MSNWAWELLSIGGPFALGLVTTALTRLRWPRNGPWMALLGVVLACGFVILTYARSPHDYAHSHGDSDGGMYLGRWWEPEFTVFVAVIGYSVWLLGVGAGVGVTTALNAAQRAHRDRAVPS